MIVLLGLELLLFGSFVSIPLPTATSRNLQAFSHEATAGYIKGLPAQWQEQVRNKLPTLAATVDAPAQPVRYTGYIPIIPLAVLTGYVLSIPLAPAATVCWVILGLAGPPLGLFLFASGGGPDYWKEPGFGYLVGMIAAAWFAGRIVPLERKSWRQITAAVGGVLLTHAMGLCWLLGSSIIILLMEGDATYYKWQPYLGEQIRNLSWYQLPYDLFFSLLLISLAFPLRWLTAILTAPDIASKNRNRPKQPLENQLELISQSN